MMMIRAEMKIPILYNFKPGYSRSFDSAATSKLILHDLHTMKVYFQKKDLFA